LKQPAPVRSQRDTGFKLGLGQVFREIGSGVTGAFQVGVSAWPGGQRSRLPEAGLSIANSLSGTIKNAVPDVNFDLGAVGRSGGGGPQGQREDASLRERYTDLSEQIIGEGYRPQDFGEKMAERGLLPALVEDVGNTAIVAGAGRVALTGGSRLAARAGATGTAGRLESAASALNRVAHPYQTAARTGSDLAIAAANRVRPGVAIESAARGARAGQVIAAADGFTPAGDEAARALSAAERSSPRAAPGITKAEAIDPGRMAAGKAAVARTVEAARAAVPDPETATLGSALANRPPAPWARAITSKLPDPVNRALAVAAPMVRRHRLKQVAADLGRNVRMAQRIAQSSRAVVDSRVAAEKIMAAVPELDRFAISRIVGEEISARLDGTDWFESVIRDGGSPEAAMALRGQARRGFVGLSQAVKDKLGPERLAALEQTLDAAAETWRMERQSNLQQLIAGRKGALGVEDAILETDAPLMTGRDLKRFNRARRDMRRAAELRRRVPDERLALDAKRVKLEGVIETRRGAAADLRRRLDEVSVRVSELHRPVPPGVRNMDRTVQAIIADFVENGGTTFDVGTGQVSYADAGYAVGGMVGGGRDLFDIPADAFAINAEALLKEVIRDNMEVWYHPDARLGLWGYTDDNGIARVAGDVSTTVENRELAILMGEARGQQALYDIAEGGDLTLSGNPDMQALARIYHNEAMKNPTSSPLLRVWREAADAAKEAGIGAQAADEVMQVWMNWDYGMHASKGTPLGTFFKNATVETGTNRPNAEFLAQTVLNLSVEEATSRALGTLSSKDVSDSLAWYYDSHDYVEALYRGKPMTLLNGTVRDSADVFYDLLAATSVMANPKQNLGRAMMAVANMSDFRKGQANAMAAAKALMKRLETTPPGRGPTPRGFATTELVAQRFVDIPELRALTESTSMIASPKQNVVDILTGTLRIDEATTADISRLPEAWTGTNKGLGDANLPREDVMRHLEAAGDPAAIEAYRQVAAMHTEILDKRGMVKAYQEAGYTPADAKRMAGLSRGADLARDTRTVLAEEARLRREVPAIHDAYEAAIMEYHGSKALAKLRSFRDNLARPAESTTVTLDTVMANLFGIDGTDWAGGGTYGMYAWDIREAAAKLSAQFGRDVRPHEVQALLWIFAKQEVGRQDWGRFLAHHDFALDEIAQGISEGRRIDDPLRDYWSEELDWSESAQRIRQERQVVQAKVRDYARHGEEVPGDLAAEYARLQSTDVASPIEDTVVTAMDRENIAALPEGDDVYTAENRFQVADDSKILGQKLDSYNIWQDVFAKIQEAVVRGDGAEATRLLNDYAAGWRSKLLGPSGGSMAVEGIRSMTEPSTSQALAAARLKSNRLRNVPPPNEVTSLPERGSIGELHQAFNEKLLGAMVMPKGKDARLVVRLFQDANLGTLTHEGAHLLRQLLPDADVARLHKVYPGLVDKGMTARKRLAEENFVGGLMGYLSSRGTLVSARGGLDNVFRKIAASLEQTYGPMLNSVLGEAPEPIRQFWDDMFAPPTEAGEMLRSPLAGQMPHPVETKRYRWETEFESMQRSRQLGEARQMRETLGVKIAHQQAMIRTLEKGQVRILDAMDGLTRSEAAAARLERGAQRSMATLDRHLVNRRPADAAWQPMYDAWHTLMEEARLDETGVIADMLQDVPKTFVEVIQLATERGFRPTHLKDVTWANAQGTLFGNLGLGKRGMENAVEAGTRKTRTGALVKQGAADRSIEALASAVAEVAHERQTNALIDHIEDSYARPIDANAVIPPGWVAWDPERTWMLTGTEASPTAIKEITGQSTKYIVPKEIKTALRSMSREYDHWAFRMITRLTSPWRTFVLTLSPRWYVNNLFGNTMLATAEGVRPRDWLSAWRKYRNGTMPQEIVGQSITSFEGGQGTILNRGVGSTARREGVRPAATELRARVTRLNEVVDEFSRTAVMDRAMRTGATREAALKRAYAALVDYGDLGPLERGFIRSVLPFYAWQKGMVKLIARFPADHTIATAVMMQLGVMHEELLKDQFAGQLPRAYEGLVLAGDQGYNTRSWNPFLDAGSLTTPHGIADAVNPFVEAMVRAMLGAPDGGFVDQYQMNATGGAMPETDPISDILETIRNVPLVRLGEQAITGQDVYGQDPGLKDALTRFMGAPRVYSEEELTAIRERVMKAQSRLNPKSDKQKAREEAAAKAARDKREAEAAKKRAEKAAGATDTPDEPASEPVRDPDTGQFTTQEELDAKAKARDRMPPIQYPVP